VRVSRSYLKPNHSVEISGFIILNWEEKINKTFYQSLKTF